MLVERLFCCAKKVNEKNDSEEENSEEKILYTSNIFTVLKNGELYFGGEIQAKDENNKIGYADVSKLPSKITITDAYMKISSENLYIDFDRIRSMSDPEMDLLAYVEGRIQAAGSMIASHKHEIKTTKKILEKNSSSGDAKKYYYYGGLEGKNFAGVNVTWESLMTLFNSGKVNFGTSDGAISFKYQAKIEEVSNKTEENTQDENTEEKAETTTVLVEKYHQTSTEIAGSGGAIGGYMIEDPVDTSPDKEEE